MKKAILAVVGLPGAGKTVAIEYLIKKLNWPKIYFGDLILDEVKKRGLAINEKNERSVREDLRTKKGMGACADLSLPKIKQTLITSSGVLIESLYSWEEYLVMKQEFGDNFKVLSIYASPKTRKQRMAVRPVRPLTPAELESRDFSQIVNLHQAGPIARADATVLNEGSFEDLYSCLDKATSFLLL